MPVPYERAGESRQEISGAQAGDRDVGYRYCGMPLEPQRRGDGQRILRSKDGEAGHQDRPTAGQVDQPTPPIYADAIETHRRPSEADTEHQDDEPSKDDI